MTVVKRKATIDCPHCEKEIEIDIRETFFIIAKAVSEEVE